MQHPNPINNHSYWLNIAPMIPNLMYSLFLSTLGVLVSSSMPCKSWFSFNFPHGLVVMGAKVLQYNWNTITRPERLNCKWESLKLWYAHKSIIISNKWTNELKMRSNPRSKVHRLSSPLICNWYPVPPVITISFYHWVPIESTSEQDWIAALHWEVMHTFWYTIILGVQVASKYCSLVLSPSLFTWLIHCGIVTCD